VYRNGRGEGTKGLALRPTHPCIATAAAKAPKVLRCGRPIRYNGRGLEVKAVFTLLRDLEPMRMWMSIRDEFNAIERGAAEARPGAALILCGLLLLIAP
jgi:hypothetical protein